MTTEKTVVSVRDLFKSFDGTQAVSGVSFELYEGEILGLLGPNGAGKTTIIQMLLGLTTFDRGEIRILGMDLKTHREKILQQVNFSSAYVSLPQSLTIRENLRVFARLYGVEDAKRKIDDVLGLFEMEDLGDKLTRHLSSGQLTRVCMAKALLNAPKLLFLDEPTASLDPDIADKTRELLKRVCRQTGLTILVTSHNMKEMEELSDRILFLHHGKIIAAGTPAEVIHLFKGEDLEEVFLKIARGKVGGG
jgi:ABC-2 type transport system ATP-binding protein